MLDGLQNPGGPCTIKPHTLPASFVPAGTRPNECTSFCDNSHRPSEVYLPAQLLLRLQLAVEMAVTCWLWLDY